MKRRCAREVHLTDRNRGGDISCALLYPNTYHVGMSSLGYQAVYQLLNENPHVLCERAFYPEASYLPFFEEQGNLRTLETQTPLQEFNVLAFSVSYEMDFPHVVHMLDMAGIPVLSAERDERHPLIIAGGAITWINPEPLADYIDAFVLGEGEAVLDRVIDVICGTEGRGKVLRLLSSLPGLYVPSLFQVRYRPDGRVENVGSLEAGGTVPRRLCSGKASRYFSSSILSGDTEFKNTMLMEIMRGCPYSCAFCAVGNAFGPFRPRDFEEIRTQLQALPAHVRRIGLVGASINCHPRFEEMLSLLGELSLSAGFSSLRLDRLDHGALDAVIAHESRTITLAPECGSEAMRRRLGKNISDDDIYRVAERALKSGISSLRLYFMIGLPGEEEKDTMAIAAMIRTLAAMGKGKRNCRLSASINTFIPKPGTVLERAQQLDRACAEERLRMLKEAVPHEVKIHAESPRNSMIQGVLARGDRKAGQVFRYARELRTCSDWDRVFRKLDVSCDFYLDSRQEDEVLPWAHLGRC